ncbi:MAG: glycosyltransferase family 2 protein, partial [Pseudanabaena sp. M074S1SP2A07QC]|nr:glycosyltransferase family 2 protein [Pseudanabaena sp. M074S1SP2A07QC]
MIHASDFFVHPQLIVGIPCFNEDKYIGETLTSLIKQTLKDFIVVISDNASTDKTSLICKEFCSTDNRFYYVCQPKNIGAGNNFTYIYQNSSSPYFMFLGAHDVLDLEFLSIHMSTLEGDRDCVLSYSSTQWIDESSKNMYTTGGSNLEAIEGSPLVRYIKSVVLIDECTAINQVFRRKALEGLNFENV